MSLDNLTIEKAQALLRAKEVSATELAESYLARIGKKNPELNAYLGTYEGVLTYAKRADEKIARGELSALTGIPLAVKDVILVEGERASASSKMLENYKATYDATAIAKLREEGAVFLGNTNCDEFAMGASNENSAFGPVRNPHDLSRVPGGSGGGSAVAVAADLCVAALGTDTGGSIRQPASYSGIVGLKPTYGAVSRYGLMALASSLDQIGPTAKTVADAEILFNAIAGVDPKDSTSRSGATSKRQETKRIGVPYHLLEKLDPRVRTIFDASVKKMEAMGYSIEEVKLPHAEYGVACYYIILPAEASSNLARYDGVRYGLHVGGVDGVADYLASRGGGFGKEVRRRIILGTYVLSAGYYDAYYGQALRVRSLITNDFKNVFGSVDALLLPTTAGLPFKIGEKSNDPVAMYLEDLFTIPANLAGVPAISVPAGFAEEGGKQLPVGVQFIAPEFEEGTLFTIGKKFESA